MLLTMGGAIFKKGRSRPIKRPPKEKKHRPKKSWGAWEESKEALSTP